MLAARRSIHTPSLRDSVPALPHEETDFGNAGWKTHQRHTMLPRCTDNFHAAVRAIGVDPPRAVPNAVNLDEGSAPISVDFSSVRIWSSLEGSHHAQGIPAGVP